MSNKTTFEKITRKIYSNSRMELEFFMFLPTIVLQGTSTTANVKYNPVLNLRYKRNKNITEEYDFTKSTFKINPKNLYTTIKFFNTIIEWLYSDKYQDLFIMNEDNGNELIFNSDYNKLHVSTPRGDFDTCIMQAVPAVITFGESKRVEGIHLYINTTNYCIPLTYTEVSILYGILKDFSFVNEMSADLLAYQFANANERYETAKYEGKTAFD